MKRPDAADTNANGGQMEDAASVSFLFQDSSLLMRLAERQRSRETMKRGGHPREFIRAYSCPSSRATRK
jgi:hypothetical protein